MLHVRGSGRPVSSEVVLAYGPSEAPRIPRNLPGQCSTATGLLIRRLEIIVRRTDADQLSAGSIVIATGSSILIGCIVTFVVIIGDGPSHRLQCEMRMGVLERQ